MRCSVFLFVLVVVQVLLAAKYPVEHVIVLMEENRSFDHMQGWMKRSNPDINGLTGKEYNPESVSDPKSKKIYVGDTAPYVGPWDPDHSLGGTTQGIFGSSYGYQHTSNETMLGFIQTNIAHHGSTNHPDNAVNMFTTDRLPIMTALSEEFAMFDMFFCSVPSCTCPNRYFAHAATAHGQTNNNPVTGGIPSKTIYQSLTEAGLTWRMYYIDSTYCALNFAYLQTAEAKKNIFPIEQFYDDVAKGNVANYTFLFPQSAPNATHFATDQHPDHNVAAGEVLMKKLYESIRASPKWNEILFVITYDEHGGYFDHVPPPSKNVPSPDGVVGNESFNYTMLGVRIPTLLISPWINKGLLIHTPENGPTPDSQYELASIPATLKNIFNLPNHLTKRDAWAGKYKITLKTLCCFLLVC